MDLTYDCLPTVSVPLSHLPSEAPFNSLCCCQFVHLIGTLVFFGPKEIDHGVEVDAEEFVLTLGDECLLD